MRYTTAEDWNEMEKRYPDAMAYIRHCEVHNELRYYKDNEYILNEWEKKRMTDLEEILEMFGNVK